MKTKLFTLILLLLIVFGAKTQVNLQSGLVAYYPFNGNANDESGNGNNGTINGATLTTDRFGNVGKAYSFDGVNDNIDLTKSPVFRPKNSYTISTWIYIDSNSTGNQVIFDNCSPQPWYGYELWIESLKVYLDTYTSSHFNVYNSNPLALNKWYNVITSYDNSNLKIYIDGTYITQIACSGEIDYTNITSPVRIGARIGSNGASFNGKIDDIRFYNRALTSDEVTQLYNSEKPATDLTTGLVAYYPFNGNANDESGNGNNGTVNGATLTADRFGNVGKAFSFNGTSNYIKIEDAQLFRMDKFSFSMWFQWDNMNTSEIDFLIGKSYENYEIHTGGQSGLNGIRFIAAGHSYSPLTNADVSNIIQLGWNHITVSYNESSSKVYINNKLVAERNSISGAIDLTKDNSPLYIGRRGDGSYLYNGKIDDIRIYNRNLSADEVTELYNTEKPATDLTSGLIAYYPFNGNANDESGNGNNGIVNGATLTADRFGNVGKAYGFDGVNDNISFSKVPMQNTDNWCLSAWANTNTLNEIKTILMLGVDNGLGGSSHNGYSLGTGYTGALSSFVSIFSDIAPIYSGSNLSTNQWYSLIIQRVNGVTNFYINGVKTNSTSTNTPRTPSEFFIGSSTGIRYFNGKIDDVRIYNRTLSSDEITQLFNSEKPATDLTTGLVAYYPFNGNANDESGNGNNGTVNGATLTTDRFGNVGKAYYFNGSNNIALNKPFLDGAYTLSLWIKAIDKQPGVHGSGAIFSNGVLHGGWGNGISANLTTNNDFIGYEKKPQSSGFALNNSSTPLIPNADYNQYTFVWDGKVNNNSAKVYYNGTLILSGACSSDIINASQNLVFGYGSDGGAAYPFKGYMDDIRIYNRELSEDEIKYLYSGQQTLKLDAPTDIQYRTTKISNSTNTKTTLIWKSVTGAKIYEIYKDGVLMGKTFSTIFYDENPEGNYKYQIASVNASGKSPLSLPCSVSVSGTNSVAGYGSLAIYITDANKQKVENALIQFTDGSSAQTLKTGFVLLKNIPYGTTKTISSIVKSGWDFAPLNGSSFSCSKSKPSMVLKYLATPTPENEPTMETFNPQYSSELVIVSDGDITLPTFTKGQDFTLDMKIASTSDYWWNGSIRLKAVRKDVEVGKTYPTYYIAKLNDVNVPMEGKTIRFTANASQLNAEAGNYELYVEAQRKEVFRQGYFILKKGKVAASTTKSDEQYKTDISVSDNTDLATGTETLFAISDAIKETTGIYEMFGNLIELDNRTVLKGELGHDIIMAYGNVNVGVQAANAVNDKIQFIKDLSDIAKENDEILRSFKMMKFIIDKAASGNPMASIFKSYIDVAESMKGAIDRISNGINDATSGLIINEHPIYLKIKKEWTGWQSYKNLLGGDYFNASEFNMYITNAEVFSDKPGSSRFTLPIVTDNTNSKRIILKTDGIPDLQFDTGEKVYLKLTFLNNRKLYIPLSSRFIKYEGLYGAMTFVLGTNTTIAKEIQEKIKIIEP